MRKSTLIVEKKPLCQPYFPIPSHAISVMRPALAIAALFFTVATAISIPSDAIKCLGDCAVQVGVCLAHPKKIDSCVCVKKEKVDKCVDEHCSEIYKLAVHAALHELC